MQRNLTLAVDDGVLAAIKVFAAERRTSVNALVREFLQSIAAKKNTTDDARETLLALVREQQGDLGTQKWDRGSLYDR